MTIVVPRARFTSARKSRTRALATTSRPIVGYVEEDDLRPVQQRRHQLQLHPLAERRACGPGCRAGRRRRASQAMLVDALAELGVREAVHVLVGAGRCPSPASPTRASSSGITSEMRRRYSTSRRDGVKPSTSRRPAVGWRSPVSIFSVVVFPAPFGPSARRPAARTVRSIASTARRVSVSRRTRAAEGGEQAGTLAMEGVGLVSDDAVMTGSPGRAGAVMPCCMSSSRSIGGGSSILRSREGARATPVLRGPRREHSRSPSGDGRPNGGGCYSGWEP